MTTENKHLPAIPEGMDVEAKAPGSRKMVPVSSSALMTFQPKSPEEAIKMAQMISRSQLCPDQYRNRPEDVFLVGMYGAEIGLTWMSALKNCYVINSRVSLYGDVMFALLLPCAAFEYLKDSYDAEAKIATCEIKRRGKPARVESFSYADAKAAGLVAKNPNYDKYTKDQLAWKARWRAARPEFADVFHGMYIVEEAVDLPPPGPLVEQREAIKSPRAITQLLDDLAGRRESAPQRAPGEEPAPPPTRVDSVTVNERKGKGPVFWAKLADTRKASTFDAKLYDKLKRAHDEGLPVIVTTKANGEYLNIADVSIHIPDERPEAPGGTDEHDGAEQPE